MSMRSEQVGDAPNPGEDFAPVFAGRYGDGEAAETSPCEVRFTETGLEITRLAHGQRRQEVLFWPYGGITSSVPLGPHATDALLGYRFLPNASLFVAEGVFARRLRDAAPHLTTRASRWNAAAPWLAVGAAAFAIGAVIWLGGLSPARAVARMLPDTTRTALGSQVVGSMTQGRQVCDGAAGRAALDRLVARLSQAAAGAKPFKIVVVDWDLVNAFAAPGEQIVLTRGLIDKAATADEVAGVLAHEMGHGLEMHPEAGIVRALGLAAATDLVFGGSGGALANIGVLLAQLSYTRDAEREADAHAIRILRQGAISPKGLADFFARIDKIEGGGRKGAPADARKGGSALDVLSTHPQSAERARIVASQPPYSSSPALAAADWTALRAICGAGRKG